MATNDIHREEPDDDWIRQGIENEMLGINEIFREAGTTVPRLPAFLRMIGERSERALQLQEVMDLDDLSTEEMKAYCTSIANDNPQWNSLLTMHSPRDLAPQLPPVTEWWLPGSYYTVAAAIYPYCPPAPPYTFFVVVVVVVVIAVAIVISVAALHCTVVAVAVVVAIAASPSPLPLWLSEEQSVEGKWRGWGSMRGSGFGGETMEPIRNKDMAKNRGWRRG
ncbi:hypothetical protein EDB84DRAFT_1560951 [Lactarius hengduanensis]|nr:hypothetical protein EDB84DRAFT_1560951 [Lactarius hengduanensis]